MNSLKQQIIDLWRISFPEDTEEFIRLHFDRKYKEENTLACLHNNSVISALQMIPYKMTFYGNEINISYISGACTKPSEQGCGLMSWLITDAFFTMYQRDVALSALIPATGKLADYYAKMGYTFVFDYSQERYETIDLLGKNITTSKYEIGEWSDSDIGDVYAYFIEKEREQPFFIQHSQDDFSVVLEDIHNEKGTLFYIKNIFNHRICGLAFTVPSEDRILVKELLADSEGERHLLLWSIAKRYSETKEIICTIFPHTDSYLHLGMARAINAEYLLTLYAKAFPEKEFTLKITDPIISANNDTFLIKSGKVSRKTENTSPGNVIKISIEQFTQAILGYHTEKLPDAIKNLLSSLSSPYMNLMMN